MLRQRVSAQPMNLEKIPPTKSVSIRLTVREGDRTSTAELVMPEDANPDRGLVSVAPPIGRALAGKEEGDVVKAPTPAGVREFEILKLVTIHDTE
jgi:transcription elongation factor GreA